MSELSIIQKTYDFIKWYVPILNGLPRDHHFILGDRIIRNLYDLLEGLLQARYASRQDKVFFLKKLNNLLDIIRYQTRLLFDFNLVSAKRYEYTNQQINAIGSELGKWLKQLQNPD